MAAARRRQVKLPPRRRLVHQKIDGGVRARRALPTAAYGTGSFDAEEKNGARLPGLVLPMDGLLAELRWPNRTSVSYYFCSRDMLISTHVKTGLPVAQFPFRSI